MHVRRAATGAKCSRFDHLRPESPLADGRDVRQRRRLAFQRVRRQIIDQRILSLRYFGFGRQPLDALGHSVARRHEP